MGHLPRGLRPLSAWLTPHAHNHHLISLSPQQEPTNKRLQASQLGKEPIKRGSHFFFLLLCLVHRYPGLVGQAGAGGLGRRTARGDQDAPPGGPTPPSPLNASTRLDWYVLDGARDALHEIPGALRQIARRFHDALRRLLSLVKAALQRRRRRGHSVHQITYLSPPGG